jgi:GNAT superfamily N-acetyltransferase
MAAVCHDPPVVTVADCERVQAGWFRVRAQLGGRTWVDDGHLWTDSPDDGLNLMFPSHPSAEVVRRGVAYAAENGRTTVGAWLGLRADPRALEAEGFERAWAPWWMTADLAAIGAADDPRIVLETVHEGVAWKATALDDGNVVGHAWSFMDGELAGIFDMAVWRGFQRRGLGTGLLREVCQAARVAGAKSAVLNATPEGKMLYSACGFTQIGEGITYYLHMR